MNWAVGLGDQEDEDEEEEGANFAETAIHVYKRYIKLAPQAREDMIEYLLEVDRIEDALPVLEEIVAMKQFNAKSGKSKSLFEIELCEFIAKYPDKCSKLVKSPVEIIRSAIERYKDTQEG